MNNKRLYIYHTFLSRKPNLGHFHSIKSLINQLDYIMEMGFNAILTNPIMQSADNSHGYHIKDFYQIDNRLGTMKDFENLLEELRKRNMYFILDITLNHCSDVGYYYKDFLQGKNDFFVVKDKPYNDVKTNIRDTIYDYRKDVNGYLCCAFNGFIPNLNVDSPNVRNEIRNILHYWLKKAPDVLHIRWDGAYHCRWATHDFNASRYAKFIRETVDEINPNINIICESWWDNDLKGACQEYNEYCRNNFDFYNVFSVVNQIRSGRQFEDIHLDYCYKNPITFFSSNHDVSRISSMLDNDVEKVKLFLKVMIEKTRNEDNVCVYYGTENNMEGLLWDCSDEVVRQQYDVFDMAKVIQDKNSLFYYTKDLIKKDKESRGIK